jgi:hypothetical protein
VIVMMSFMDIDLATIFSDLRKVKKFLRSSHLIKFLNCEHNVRSKKPKRV